MRIYLQKPYIAHLYPASLKLEDGDLILEQLKRACSSDHRGDIRRIPKILLRKIGKSELPQRIDVRLKAVNPHPAIWTRYELMDIYALDDLDMIECMRKSLPYTSTCPALTRKPSF